MIIKHYFYNCYCINFQLPPVYAKPHLSQVNVRQNLSATATLSAVIKWKTKNRAMWTVYIYICEYYWVLARERKCFEFLLHTKVGIKKSKVTIN